MVLLIILFLNNLGSVHTILVTVTQMHLNTVLISLLLIIYSVVEDKMI